VSDGPGVYALSVVIITRGRSSQCERLCIILEEQFRHPAATTTAEIILVFDGCPVYDWVPQRQPYQTVHLARRSGIASARDAGIEHARSPVIAFLDDDALPARTWLSSLERGLASYPDHVAFGGRVTGHDSTNLYAQLRDLVYYLETFGAWYLRDDSGPDQPGTPYVNGGNSAYRRPAIQSSGAFDQALPAYSDVELGRRLELHEHGVLLTGMSILHDHPATFRIYMERCIRSGKARALIWQRQGYREHAPRAVLLTILSNIGWNNYARARRLRQRRAKAVAVLFCQEVAHGFGYMASLVQNR
jgi:cellulose synthase/poly-beta-1,6-N-acetylglucosamine synthase-like glycosyltransferase